jgi:sugar phosphate isomerase/epimerase
LIFGFVASPGKLEDYLKWAAKNGFCHIEIDGNMPSNFPDQFSGGRVYALQKSAEELGISLSYHTSYGVNLADPFKELREVGKDLVRKCIEVSDRLMAEWVTLHPGYKIGFPDKKNERLTYFSESLGYLLEVAENHGVSIAVENLNKLLVGEVFYLGDSISEMKEIFASSNSKSLKMTLDFGHAHLNEGIEEYFRTFSDKIINAHIHDNTGKGVDEHLPIGKGNIDWETTCNVIREVGYKGPLCLEVPLDEEKLAGKNKLAEYFSEE